MATQQLQRVVDGLKQVQGHAETDGQLLEAFLTQRDGHAFAEILRRHGPMVLGVCRRVLRDHHEAEDAFQAVFLVLLRKAASIRPRDMVGSWLHGVAYRTACRARANTEQRRLRSIDAPPSSKHVLSIDTELAAILDRELSRLPDKYRLPIVLCDLEARTRREAAKSLGWPEGTVAGRLVRGRSMLAKRLLRLGVAPSLAGVSAAITGANAVAAIPPGLTATMRVVCTRLASGVGLAGVIPTRIVALADSVIQGLATSKWKAAAYVLVAFGILSFGAGVGALDAQACQLRRKRSPAPVACLPCPPPIQVAPSPVEPLTAPNPAPPVTPPSTEAHDDVIFDPNNRLDAVLLGWNESMKEIKSVMIRDCVRTAKSARGTETWEGEIRYLEPDYLALRMLKKDSMDYELLVLNRNALYEYRPLSRKLVVWKQPGSANGFLDWWVGMLVGGAFEDVPTRILDLHGNVPPPPATFREGLEALKRRYDLTITKDVGPNNPHYIYIQAIDKSRSEKSFRRAQFVLYAATKLPRRFWSEFSDGREVTWDFPSVDTATKLKPEDFTSPPPPVGWETAEILLQRKLPGNKPSGRPPRPKE